MQLFAESSSFKETPCRSKVIFVRIRLCSEGISPYACPQSVFLRTTEAVERKELLGKLKVAASAYLNRVSAVLLLSRCHDSLVLVDDNSL